MADDQATKSNTPGLIRVEIVKLDPRFEICRDGAHERQVGLLKGQWVQEGRLPSARGYFRRIPR